jgi:hypothetical protein
MTTKTSNRPTPTQYAYSTDGESYTGSFDTIQEAAEECVFHDAEDAYSDMSFYVGEIVHKTFTGYMDFEHIFQSMAEEVGEVPDSYVDEWPKVMSDTVPELQALIETWATKHKLQPTFFGIGSVIEFEYTDGKLERKGRQ